YPAVCAVCALQAPAPPRAAALSLHDALPISAASASARHVWHASGCVASERNVFNQASGALLVRFRCIGVAGLGACIRFGRGATRSEEHTSELQSPYDLVCRLLLEKKKKTQST